TDKIIKDGSDYIDSINTQDNRDKAVVIYKSSKEKLSELTYNISYPFNKFNVEQAQRVTYEVRVVTKDGVKGSGTAIALSSSGKLITAYHNIDSYKSIVVIDSQANEYNATVGDISAKNDLAYLYIDTKDKPFVTFAKDTKLGDDIYLLSYEDILLKGIVSQNNPDSVMLNVEVKKGTSGGGVFNDKNELVAILLRKDYLDKTSYAVKSKTFSEITQAFIYKKELLNLDSNNYDNSYCYDKNELKIWAKYAKSKNPKTQEFHALFIGLCKKVEDRDLTTEEAQLIYNQTKTRLFGKQF
ncbi:MAG: serine protease, partial [Campylobacterota bacterium]|nr:serine protease [Campylobacterota bacterium]